MLVGVHSVVVVVVVAAEAVSQSSASTTHPGKCPVRACADPNVGGPLLWKTICAYDLWIVLYVKIVIRKYAYAPLKSLCQKQKKLTLTLIKTS